MAANSAEPPTFAQVILGMAAEAGAHTAFGLPGVQNLAFWAEIAGDKNHIITVRHEQTTVYGADGWARATGALGLALTTTGPGAANAVAAFGEAAACGSPVLLVASEVATRYLGTDARVLHQSPDQAGLFRPLAKAAFTPRTVDEVLPAVAAAISAALTPPRGPVYLDVPTDLLGARCVQDFVGRSPEDPAQGRVEAAATAIRDAERVAIWAGGGALGAGEELRVLAERLGAPVVTTWAGRGLLAGHPLLLDAPIHEPEAGEVLAWADLLLVVGSAFDGMATKNGTAPLPATRAAVNVDPAHLGAASAPALAVLGDARQVLAALLDTDLSQRDAWAGDLASVRRAMLTRLAADPRTSAAVTFLASVEGALGDDTTVVCDMAVAGYWAGSYLPARRTRALQYPVGWGTLGYALPASVGAGAVGSTLAVSGDGGLMFAVGELATIVQEQLPVTVLVVDDAGYGMLRFDQDHAGTTRRGVDLHTPDLVALAESFGMPAVRVDDMGEPLQQALTAALGTREPRLVTVRAALYPPRTTSPRWHE